MKKLGAAGFTGDDSVFSLHFVNSRAAEAAYSLHRLVQYSGFNLKFHSSQVRKENLQSGPEVTNSGRESALQRSLEATPKSSLEKKSPQMMPSVSRLKSNPEPTLQESVDVEENTDDNGSEKVSVSEEEEEEEEEEEVEVIAVDEVNQSKMNKSDEEKSSGSRASANRMCEMTEEDLLNIDWQQGKTLPTALKSLAKFLISIDVVEVVEMEPTKTIVFKIAEKKKFIKILKIYSRNETNSFDKLHSATARLILSPSKSNGMFGLTFTKKKDDQEFVRRLKASYPITRIEERSHVRIIWLPSKLDYFRALADKSLNVNFLPSSQNYLDLKPQEEEIPKNPSLVTNDQSEVKHEATPVIKEPVEKEESSQFMVSEKAIFGFLWRSLGEAFKIKDEQVISRQLTEFIKNVKCSKITSGDDGLVFHFATKEDLNTMVAQYCPEFVDEPEKLTTLSRKFTIIPSRGQYGIFSAMPINIQDFHPIAECKLYYSSLWFSSKMDLIKALRDERITRLYSALYIDCRNIMILQSTRPQTPIKLCPVNVDLLCARNYHSKQTIKTGFGGNLSYSRCDPRLVKFVPVVRQRAQGGRGRSSLVGGYKYELNLENRKKLVHGLIRDDDSQFRNKTVEVAASDIRNILLGKDTELNASLKDIKMRRVELYLKEKLGMDREGDFLFTVPQEDLMGSEERFEEVGDVGEELLVSDGLGFNTLFISYDEEKDAELSAKLQEDLSWFDVPLSIQPGTHQATGNSILKIQMKNKEVAIAAYLGLKLKYPGLEIDKTGRQFVFGNLGIISNFCVQEL